jgi:hypothetical protein
MMDRRPREAAEELVKLVVIKPGCSSWGKRSRPARVPSKSRRSSSPTKGSEA